jgi:hypothetical protein
LSDTKEPSNGKRTKILHFSSYSEGIKESAASYAVSSAVAEKIGFFVGHEKSKTSKNLPLHSTHRPNQIDQHFADMRFAALIPNLASWAPIDYGKMANLNSRSLRPFSPQARPVTFLTHLISDVGPRRSGCICFHSDQ